MPATSLVTEPSLERRGKLWLLAWTIEANPEAAPSEVRIATQELQIVGSRAFKYTGRSACTVEMIQTAYAQLVDMGETPWLLEVKERVLSYIRSYPNLNPPKLRHLMIYFDDSACYEFIAESFEFAEDVRPAI